jgi:CARDB
MAIDPSSNVHLIWMDKYSFEEKEYPLFYSFIPNNATNDGNSIYSNFTGEVISTKVPSYSRPSVLLDSHGIAYIIWTRNDTYPKIVMKNTLTDISITLQNQSNNKYRAADNISLTMIVQNDGQHPLFQVPVEITVNGNVSKQVIIEEIGPGENATLYANLGLAWGRSRIQMSVDSNESIPDLNRTNNQLVIEINNEKTTGGTSANPYIPSILIAILSSISLLLFWSGIKKDGA